MDMSCEYKYFYSEDKYKEKQSEEERLSFRADVFENMAKLRLLHIHGQFTSCEPTFLPRELKWFRWRLYPFPSLSIANMSKLVGFEMNDGQIEHLWMGTQAMQHLKFINLGGSRYLKWFPDISMAPYVEKLILSHCWNLVEVHSSLGSLERIEYLDMTNCSKLKSLPPLKMKSLKTLLLSSCIRLETFPEVSPCMLKLSEVCLDECHRLRYIPNSICALENLKWLKLDNCKELQRLPEKLGSMKKLEMLSLRVFDRNIIDFPTSVGMNLCSLRYLNMKGRQIRDEDFPDNLHALSSLENLNLSDNAKLIHLPDSISHLSSLKHLGLHDCEKLEGIHRLPVGIQVLKACNCKALEYIEDLAQEYKWLYKIWLAGCEKLMEKKENRERLGKILRESFFMECAVVDRRVSTAICGSKIPRWFKEQRDGSEIALQLPPKSHAAVMGFAVCGVFPGKWESFNPTRIDFKFENNGRLVSKSEVDCMKASASASANGNGNGSVLITYIPFSFLQQQMYDDFGGQNWSLSVEGSLLISISKLPRKVVRCGAHIIYKEDLESIQQVKTTISDYYNLESVYRKGNLLRTKW